ncbi:MAG: divalent-cation tolerance protein CutA [Myxococcaceae bacterium]
MILVFVTCPTQEKAAEIARTLVEEKLAACGNLFPGLRSIYRWEGKVQDESEALLLLKTLPEHFDALRARVVTLHPYDCPEVVAVPVSSVHPPYLEWVTASTRG